MATALCSVIIILRYKPGLKEAEEVAQKDTVGE